MNHATHKTRSLVHRAVRWSLAVSLLLHAVLLAVMVFGTVRSWLDQRPIHVIQASLTYASSARSDDGATATVVINQDDPVPADFQRQFAESLAATEQLTEAERIDALDNATNRLNRISSEASLDDVAKRLQAWLGLMPRAESPLAENPAAELALKPAEGPADPPSADVAEAIFDYETAQLHDVKRVVDPGNRPQYFCVLLDAGGRTIEVPLEESEGEPIYSLMEKIKAHPLLEKIYRQLAMPLLDQMVKAERGATAAASAARSRDAVGQAALAVPASELPVGEDAPGQTFAPR